MCFFPTTKVDQVEEQDIRRVGRLKGSSHNGWCAWFSPMTFLGKKKLDMSWIDPPTQ